MSAAPPIYTALKEVFGSKGSISYSDCDLSQLRKCSEAFAEVDEEFRNFCEGTKIHTWRKANFFDAFGDLLNRKPETWAGFTTDERTKIFRDKPALIFKKDLSNSFPDLYAEVFDAGRMDETGDKLSAVIESAKTNALRKRDRPPSSDVGITQPPNNRARDVDPGSSITALTAGELKEFLLKDFGTRLVSAEEDIKTVQQKTKDLEKTQIDFTERLDQFDTQITDVSDKLDSISGKSFNLRREALKFVQSKKRHRSDVGNRRAKGIFKVSTGDPKFLNFAGLDEPSGFNVGALEQLIKERFQMIPGTLQCRISSRHY